MLHRILAFVVSFAALSPTRSSAQTASGDAPDRSHGGWLLGFSAGLPGYERQPLPELFTVGLNVTHAKPSTLGMDFSIGTMPRILSNGAVVLGSRLDAVLPLAITQDFWLVPAAGGSLIGAISSEGGGSLTGVNAGLSTIVWSGPVGVRTGITWHHFVNSRDAVWLAEIGFVSNR